MARYIDEHDSMLLSILQQQGSIDEFLETMYAFLYRRTDYFRILTPEKNMGFPPGIALKKTLDAFRKYQDIAGEEETREHSSATNRNTKPSHITEVEPNNESPKSIDQTMSKSTTTADTYNGGVLEKYSWSQTISDLEIKIPVGKNIIRGKQVECEIKNKSLSVSLPRQGDEVCPLVVEGKFPYEVDAGESMWTLIPGSHVFVTLEKRMERFWQCALEGDEQIDITKVDSVKKFEDLEDEAKMKIQQLMYDEEQKRQCKPTSDQQNMTKMLKDGWNIEGSPFKDQQFDPSAINFNTDTPTANINLLGESSKK